MNSLLKLWKFSRPHTIIGSVLSITALYLIACGQFGMLTDLNLWVLVLISALGCNVFIVGLNQIIDIEIDKINKPFLPIASGELSIKQGYIIITISLLISLIVAGYIGGLFFLIILGILIIGILYSVPPIRLKKHHLPAAVAITLVRGIIVNYGIGYFFVKSINQAHQDLGLIISLTVFMSLFSIAIAWFKDLYDYEGDKIHKIKTLAVLYDSKLAFKLGISLVFIGFIYQLLYFYNKEVFLFYTTLLLFIAFIVYVYKSKVDNQQNIYRFYMTFWVFFFAEYLMFIGDAIQKISGLY